MTSPFSLVRELQKRRPIMASHSVLVCGLARCICSRRPAVTPCRVQTAAQHDQDAAGRVDQALLQQIFVLSQIQRFAGDLEPLTLLIYLKCLRRLRLG